MNNAKILIYDGTFNGFLTAVFTCFEEKLYDVEIQQEGNVQNGLFAETQSVYTQEDKAKRVWAGIQKRSSESIKNIYFAFLSEHKAIEALLYHYIQKLMKSKENIVNNYADDCVLKINQLARAVGREKHRMEAFVRFQRTKDLVYFANIEPDFNVLPLISKHFKNRYADQQWVIYDIKRSYGLYYDLETVAIISLDLEEPFTNSIHKNNAFTKEENIYQELWNNYFNSTTIKSRINKKLHTQHVPKRYWKYLSEKKQAS